MNPKYHYGKQYIDVDDVDAVVKTLNSDFLTQGPKVHEFEDLISKAVGSKFCVSVNSATSALHIACMSLDLQPGDILWTSSISFVASANCGLYCGATIDFVDINDRDFNISPDKLSNKLMLASKEDCLPKVLVVVHMCGNPANLRQIKDICSSYNVKIIEDASHALGALYGKNSIGDCSFSELTVFSFHPVKMITTGEGGVVTTNSNSLYQKLIKLRSHGITRNEDEMNESHGPWYYEQKMLGFNYRMTDLAATLGISQIKKLPEFVKQRNYLADLYKQLIDSDEFDFQHVNETNVSSYHLFVAQFKKIKGLDKLKTFFALMKDEGIYLNIHYIPIHIQPYFKSLKNFTCLQSSEDYYLKSFSLPIYYQLQENDIKYISNKLNQNIKRIK